MRGSDGPAGAPHGRRRALIHWGIAVGAVTALIAGGIGATHTPLFAAEQVLVRGTRQLSAQQVRQISGLVLGVNVVHADLRRAAQRLEANGWVESASIRRELPATLVVEIRERTPVGSTLADGRPAVLTADGTVIVGARIPRLPDVRSLVAPGPVPSFDGAALALEAMGRSLRARVSAVSILGDDSLLVQLRRGAIVMYGPPTEVEQKAQAIDALLRWARRQHAGVESFDVTVPQAPTARLIGASSARRIGEPEAASPNRSVDVNA